MAVRSNKRTPAKKTTAPSTASRDVTQYADKVPTEFHKCFARWIVEEVGYRPTNRKDFLMAVSIATAARNLFQQSEYLANWREETGEAKRGPKPKNAPVNAKGRSKAKPAPEPEPEESEWSEEDVEAREDELMEMTVAALKKLARSDCEATAADIKELKTKADVVGFILDYEFPEDDEDEDDEEDDDDDDSEEDDEDEDDEEDEDDSEEDDDEEEEVEEAPKGRRGARSSGRNTEKTTPARRGKAASGAKAKSGKDDYLF